MITVERVRNSSALILSQFVGEGEDEYLFTRTYYGYTVRKAKAQFRLALEHEAEGWIK